MSPWRHAILGTSSGEECENGNSLLRPHHSIIKNLSMANGHLYDYVHHLCAIWNNKRTARLHTTLRQKLNQIATRLSKLGSDLALLNIPADVLSSLRRHFITGNGVDQVEGETFSVGMTLLFCFLIPHLMLCVLAVVVNEPIHVTYYKLMVDVKAARQDVTLREELSKSAAKDHALLRKLPTREKLCNMEAARQSFEQAHGIPPFFCDDESNWNLLEKGYNKFRMQQILSSFESHARSKFWTEFSRKTDARELCCPLVPLQTQTLIY